MITNEEIIEQLKKLKFHVRLLAEAVDHASNPISALVVEFDWSESDLNKVHDIFEAYDELLSKKEEINWYGFQLEFEKKLGINYPSLKSVVLAFFRNGQWTSVCHSYAESFGENIPIELKSIVRANVR